MTSASSSTEKIKTAGFLPLFSNILRQKWTTMLLSAILMFFTLPVPVMMVLSSYKNSWEQYSLENDVQKYMLEWGNSIRFALIPLMAILGVIMVCAMTRYTKKRETVDFYHSLPITRGRLYASWLLAGLTLLIVPLIIMSAVTLIILGANDAMSFTLFGVYMRSLGESLVYMLLLGGISVVVGMISGTTVVHLLLCGTAVFIIPLFYWAVVYFASIFNENMWVSWYYNSDFMAHLSPALRYMFNSERLNLTETIIWLLLAAAMFVGGYFIYRVRKSERAGTPVVFRPVGEVIKYLLIIMMTLLGGIFFYEVMYSFGWTVFGMVCGALLTFMLTNSVLAKTAKSMFRGWKGLCVYGGVCVLTMCVLIFNLFGINTNIPSESDLARVYVLFDDGLDTMSFSDDEVMSALYRLYTDSDWREPYGYGSSSTSYEVAEDALADAVLEDCETEMIYAERQTICFVFYPKFGLPQAKSVTINNKSDFSDELRVLCDSAEFREQYKKLLSVPVKQVNNVSENSYVNEYLMKKRLILNTANPDFSKLEFLEKFNAAARADVENIGYDTFQQPALGQALYIAGGKRNTSFFYLTTATPAMNELMYSLDPAEYMDDIYSWLAERVTQLTVCRLSDGKEYVVTDKSELCEIFASLYSVDDSLDISPFTAIDTEYAVEYMLEDEIISYDENGDEVYTVENTRSISYFLKGKVPAFVAERMR